MVLRKPLVRLKRACHHGAASRMIAFVSLPTRSMTALTALVLEALGVIRPQCPYRLDISSTGRA
jgi:hypothetical protein